MNQHVAIERLPHANAARRLMRLLVREEAAQRTLAVLEDEFRQFRTMQAIDRVANAEITANKLRDQCLAAIEEWRSSLVT